MVGPLGGSGRTRPAGLPAASTGSFWSWPSSSRVRHTIEWHRSVPCCKDNSRVVKPKNIQHINDELAILWEDGHESYYKLETLRRACPCAGCSGERDVMGDLHGGALQRLAPAGFELKSIEPVGGYAIRPTWGDGHATGLYSFDALRRNCPCEQCQAAREK